MHWAMKVTYYYDWLAGGIVLRVCTAILALVRNCGANICYFDHHDDGITSIS